MIPLKKTRIYLGLISIVFLAIITCSFISFVSASNCNNDINCGISSFIGTEYCHSNDVYKDFISFSCISPGTNGYCVNHTTQTLVKSCNDSVYGSYGTNYCENNSVYRSRTNMLDHCSIIQPTNLAGCVTSFAFDTELVEQCQNGCSDGACNPSNATIICNTNSDCGQNSFIGNPICNNNDLFKNYITFNCINPGTTNSHCSNSTNSQLFLDCGNNIYDNASVNQCINGNVYRSTNYVQKGCFNNVCFSNNSVQLTFVQQCTNGCSNGACNQGNITCSKDLDCGQNSYTGNYHCNNNDLYNDYDSYSCTNPGTVNSKCINSVDSKFVENCLYGCYNDHCLTTKNNGHENKADNNSLGDNPVFPTYEVSNYSNIIINPPIQIQQSQGIVKTNNNFIDNNLFIIIVIVTVLLILLFIILILLR